VHPAYRGRGAGSQLMQALMRWLQIYAKGATVGLMSVAGAEDFYAHYGFKQPYRLGWGLTRQGCPNLLGVMSIFPAPMAIKARSI